MERYSYINNPYGFKLPDLPIIDKKIINTFEEFPEETQMILKEIVVKLQDKDKLSDFYIFGSRIKGYWTEKSDFDILVVTHNKELSLKKLKNIKFDVKVDINVSNNFSIRKDRFIKLN